MKLNVLLPAFLQWIVPIFGNKQNRQAAIDAFNCSHEKTHDIHDFVTREAINGILQKFWMHSISIIY